MSRDNQPLPEPWSSFDELISCQRSPADIELDELESELIAISKKQFGESVNDEIDESVVLEGKEEPEFQAFPKIHRLMREIIITEKIDGTNACIYINDYGDFYTASRRKWITPENDNFGFSRWAYEHQEELMELGPGRHYGEWWGPGIQRGYGQKEKKFSLFNASRWVHPDCTGISIGETLAPDCCDVVPVLFRGMFSSRAVEDALNTLKDGGSQASPGFMRPEGVVIFHVASGHLYKRTIEGDEKPKSVPLSTGNEKRRFLENYQRELKNV